MKKCLGMIGILLLLTGCAPQGELETVQDDLVVQTASVCYELQLTLPEEASAPVMEGDTGKLYLCDTYSISVQKLPGGDLSRTVTELSGKNMDQLSVFSTEKEGFPCHRFAWAVAGEGTQQSCLSLIMDDGDYHHTVTVMTDYEHAGSLRKQWDSIMASAMLVSTAQLPAGTVPGTSQ